MIRKGRYFFTSESVSMGHPDKVADQISDSVLDAVLAADPMGRVACETLVKTGLVVVSGEITTSANINFTETAREAIRAIGYNDPALGFDADSCGVVVTVEKQSPDINQGVTEGLGLHKEMGAGDQGMMFGFACRETPELMPMPIMLAHKLMMRQAEVRQKKILDFIKPDAKAQVTIEYDSGRPVRVDTIVLSTQHSESASYEDVRNGVVEKIIKAVIPSNLLDSRTLMHVNPTGRFVYGGPKADCGLTGRKIIVDTYGGMGRHGGGAFSGKDPSKVDRTASYMARHAAKNVVAAGLADTCEVQVSYAIGIAEPVSLLVDTKGTAKMDEAKIEKILRDTFPFTPKGMIEYLNLRRPIFAQTARFGHFGRTGGDFTWEKTDKVESIRKIAGI